MNVLVTTDGSARSEAVLAHAAKWATATNCGLVLMRALDPRIDCADQLALHLDEAVAKTSAAWIEGLSAMLSRHAVAGTPLVSIKARGEDSWETILRVAGEQGASLIAMATRGAGILHHLVLGSVAMGVLRRTTLPIMVTGAAIEAPPSAEQYRVLATTDGSEASFAVVPALRPAIESSEVEVTLLSLCWPGQGDQRTSECSANLARLRTEMQRAERVTEVVREVPVIDGLADAIVQEAERLHASAIAMATHGHGAAYHLFAGSTALGVVSRSPLPVILARSSAASTDESHPGKGGS